jgi:DNA-binding LacI/PurR family transcriptional regulator
MAKTKPRVTIRDVARRAGVSHMSVSRVINKSARVSSKTRAAVEKAIAELDYRPSAIARSLARGKTHTLACLTPNLTDFTFASIIEGAEVEARRRGYFLIASAAPDEQAFDALQNQLISTRRIDGLIVFNPYADDRHVHLRPGVPVVFVGSRHRGGRISSVALDEESAAAASVEYFLDQGHRQIMTITGPTAEDCVTGRLQGYRRALSDAGLAYAPEHIFVGDWSANSGYAAVESWLAQGIPFTAIFAQNDRMAVGAIAALRDASLCVPADVSVIGFDDMPLASYFDPPLSTLRQDMPLIGREAVRLLLESIEHPERPSQHLQLPVELVIRSSTAEFSRERRIPERR